MPKIEELPDDHEEANSAMQPDLPPHLADTHHQTVDEVVKDLKKSPFFMTSLEDAGDEPNPELDAIKSLLYEGPRSEIAENFREQGNEYAREKNWKEGKELYSKGLAALKAERKDEDPVGSEEDKKERKSKELLLVNRALCHLELQNYRSCILDCTECLSLEPANVKAHYRMASALFKLGKLSDALTTATAGLKLDGSNKALQSLLEKINAKKTEKDAIEARKKQSEERAVKEKYALAYALKSRGIKYRRTPAGANLDLPDDAIMRLEGDKLSPDSTLIFPATVLYPLHMESDFVKTFRETETLAQHLEYLLPPPWDSHGEYTAKTVEAYMVIDGGLVKWGKNVALGKVLGEGKVEVLDGLVNVSIVPKARAEEWIESSKHKGEAHGGRAESARAENVRAESVRAEQELTERDMAEIARAARAESDRVQKAWTQTERTAEREQREPNHVDFIREVVAQSEQAWAESTPPAASGRANNWRRKRRNL